MKDMGKRIAAVRKERKISQDELARRINCSKQTISNYERGVRRPDYEVLEAIADALNAPMAFFLSKEEQQDELRRIYSTYDVPNPFGAAQYPNIVPLKRVKIPVLGGIAAGKPILAEQEFDTYIEMDEDVEGSFGFRVEGDSMEPTVRYGDLVFIRPQDDVNDGEIAAVIVNDSATLKRVYHIQNGLTLISDNAAKYSPMTVTYPEQDYIHIFGKAVAFKRIL